jgi:hypothetical protein
MEFYRRTRERPTAMATSTTITIAAMPMPPRFDILASLRSDSLLFLLLPLILAPPDCCGSLHFRAAYDYESSIRMNSRLNWIALETI